MASTNEEIKEVLNELHEDEFSEQTIEDYSKSGRGNNITDLNDLDEDFYDYTKERGEEPAR